MTSRAALMATVLLFCFASYGETTTTPKLPKELLWMRESGEYRAICIQTYKLALNHIPHIAALNDSGKPAAVIMDLDETILDNSEFTVKLIAEGKDALPWAEKAKLFNEFMTNDFDKVRAVPGALEFTQAMKRIGVKVVFISNRDESVRLGTLRTLQHLKIIDSDADNETFLLLDDPKDQNEGSKESRRQRVAEKFHVVALFGDNLRDLSESFKIIKGSPTNTAKEARSLVDKQASNLGSTWFVIPNPSYGEWEKAQ